MEKYYLILENTYKDECINLGMYTPSVDYRYTYPVGTEYASINRYIKKELCVLGMFIGNTYDWYK